MPRALFLLFRGYMGHWSTLALLPLLALQGLGSIALDERTQFSAGSSGEVSFTLLVVRDIFSLLIVGWLGVVVGAALRQEMTRPGSSLLPGYTQTNLRFAAAFSAVVLALLLLLRIVAGTSLFGWLSLALPALGCGLWIAWFLPGRGRGEVYQVLALLLIGLLLLPAVSRMNLDFLPAWLESLRQPPLQVASLLLGATACIAFGRKMAGLYEDSSLSRRNLRRTFREVFELDGRRPQPGLLLRLMPPFGLRRIVPAPHAEFTTLGQRAAQLRMAGGAFSPVGSALLMLPWVLILTAIAAPFDDFDVSTFTILLMLNAIPTVSMHYSRCRLRQEWMRPAARGDLLDALGLAALRDIVIYAATILVMQLGLQLVVDASTVRDSMYWGPHTATLGIIALATGIWFVVASWTRWAGLLVFFVVVLLTTSLFPMLAHSRFGENPLTWAVLGLLAGLQMLWLVPVARYRWRQVEIGAT